MPCKTDVILKQLWFRGVCVYLLKRWRRGKFCLEMWWICWKDRHHFSPSCECHICLFIVDKCKPLNIRIHHSLLIGFVFVKKTLQIPSDSSDSNHLLPASHHHQSVIRPSLLWWVYVDMSHPNRRLQAAQAAAENGRGSSDHPSLEFAFFDRIGKAWQILEANRHPGCRSIGQQHDMCCSGARSFLEADLAGRQKAICDYRMTSL